MKSITIIGKGFAGLSLAYFLLKANYKVELFFSPKKKCASGIAAGLLHPFANRANRLNFEGFEALKSTLELMNEVQALSKTLFFEKTGIHRKAVFKDQVTFFKEAANTYPGITFLNAEGDIFIDDGYQVDCKKYLQSIEEVCLSLGLEIYEKEVKDLTCFSEVIVANGSGFLDLIPSIPMTKIKGQLIELLWPKELAPLKCPLNAEKYIVMSADKKSCWVGGTYERTFTSDEPDADTAKKLLLPFIPQELQNTPLLAVESGVRVSAKDHLPCFGRLNEKVFFLTGLGSKGLLYHAHFAKKLLNTFLDSKKA